MSFTKEEVRNRITKILSEKILFESEVYFTQDDFKAPQSEESLYLFTVLTSECNDLLTCWIKGLEKIIEFENLAENEAEDTVRSWYEVDCSPALIGKFNREYKWMTQNLPTEIRLIDRPFRAFQISDVWHEQVFILENESSYMLVYWETTS